MHKIVAVLAAGLWISACSSSAPRSAAPKPPPQKIPIGQLPAIDADAVLAHTKVLSSDQYEGRGPGTKGEELVMPLVDVASARLDDNPQWPAALNASLCLMLDERPCVPIAVNAPVKCSRWPTWCPLALR